MRLQWGPGSGTILLQSATVNGTELAHNTTGNSWYVDYSGGKSGDDMQCDTVKVVRVSSSLIEVALIDSHSKPLQFEHRMIMTEGVSGVYGYIVMTAVEGYGLNEVRFLTRWDRCLFTHAYNFERGHDSEQPTYAYLYTMPKIQDETWLVNGVNNASLPCPTSNAGGLPAGTVYTKYLWSLYHAENPFFGHYTDDASIGVFHTPLGGMSGPTTSAANYGAGPNHQDLAIHQDAIILDYIGVNHYGEPSFPISAGFTRFYGPFLTFFVSDPAAKGDPSNLLAAASSIAAAAIAESQVYLSVVEDARYPTARSTVTGTIKLTDGRSAEGMYALLCTEVTDGETVGLHEPTYFTLADAAGFFNLTGIPPDTYSLYLFSSQGSVTDQYRQDNIVITGGNVDLGTVTWTPSDAAYTHLWQIGKADRSGGEMALGDHVRAWLLPGGVPSDLTFTIGSSHEPTDWYYAQTQGGAWTVSFTLSRAYTGTGHLTVSASLTDGFSPVPALNGQSTAFTGAMPSGTDSTLSRQAVRSGYPRLADLTFDAALLKAGQNTLTFTRPAAPGGTNNTGMGWDTLILSVDESCSASASAAASASPPAPPRQPQLRVQLLPAERAGGRPAFQLQLANTGPVEANDVRLTAFMRGDSAWCNNATASLSLPLSLAAVKHQLQHAPLAARDPRRNPAPLAAQLAAGQMLNASLQLAGGAAVGAREAYFVFVSSNGGRASGAACVEL